LRRGYLALFRQPHHRRDGEVIYELSNQLVSRPGSKKKTAPKRPPKTLAIIKCKKKVLKATASGI
jgi:hypothetical protein